MRILFVVNPISGGVVKNHIVEQIQSFCAQQIYIAEFYFTNGKNDAEILAVKISEMPYDAVVAVGGDGTVNLVGKLLIHKKIPMAIIPSGSGNGLSKDLAIPQDITFALQTLEKFNSEYIDTLDINGKPSLHLADLGFNALIVKRFSESETRGSSTYAWHLLREYVNYTASRYTISANGQPAFGTRAFMLTVANGNVFGSNLLVNPQGKLNDGVFEICVIEEFPKALGVNLLYQMFDEGIQDSVYSYSIRCKEAKIENIDYADFQIDGEAEAESPESLLVKIVPASLRVILHRE
jgi:diacylglycerol kinase (ATP)